MPQPVDFQTEVARVTAAERIQQIADRVSLAAQQRLAVEEQESRIDAETVVNQPQPKGEEVDTEARRRNPYMGRKRKRSAQSSEKDDHDAAARTSSTVDEHGQTADGADDHQFDVTI